MEERLCEAAITGNTISLGEILAEDSIILDRVVVGCFKRSPLHVAVSLGHADFVRALLHHTPELAEVLDSQQRSALHLAAAKGRSEIAKELTRGKVEVLEELVQVNPHAARVRVGKGETILHLCVKHNQLRTLEKLLEIIKVQEFVNAKDDGGNTLLHLAVADKKN
ncbi:hypothetical protein Acr_11g0010690 [Actinidia rufa]|uniref:Ankyrin repeat family protein n=1 Tax=Actinidia rufa TaxID=165716 RepID=A0A7J0FDU8_9ERIC|nr:hypothetical protein Acr_11g0010690 [Actinidia rufa]